MIVSMEAVASDSCLGTLLMVLRAPFSAYSRKRFSPATPIEEVRFRSIISGLTPGTGNGYIQSSFAACPVQWSEIHADAPFCIRAIAHREENNIAFVSLHILQVLDEQRFFTFQCKCFQFGVKDEEVG